MNTFLLSYAEEDQVLPFFDHIKSDNFFIIVTNGDYKAAYSSEGERRRIRNVNDLLSGKNIVIRWGNRSKIPPTNIVYNVGTSIHNASDKKLARTIMEDNDIQTIETLRIREDLPIMHYPVIIRPLHHERGNNFHVAKNESEARSIISSVFKNNYNNFYVSSFFPRTNEYRVYCAHNRVLYIQEKVGVGQINILKDNIKNVNKVPWTTIPWGRISSQLNFLDIAVECIKTTNLFKLDFSAIDVLYDSKSQQFRICEVNTMPELLSYGFERFSMYFDMLIKYSTKNGDRLKRKECKSENEILWKNEL